MTGPIENKSITINLKEDPKPEDIIDGMSFNWWIEQVTKIEGEFHCTGNNPDCRERYHNFEKCFQALMKTYIYVRWAILNPEKVDQEPRPIRPLDQSIFKSLKKCDKCGSVLIPLSKIDSRFYDCCFYCGFGGPILTVKIQNESDTLVSTENYCLPPPPEFVGANDSVFMQSSGVISLSKIEGTIVEKYINDGYQIGHKHGISLKTDHEAALLQLLSQQSNEIRRIEEGAPKNEYIIKNRIEIVVECKQIEAFEQGKIKEKPGNPNTLTNALDKALQQHSGSLYRDLPILVHFWVKYQNRLPLLNREYLLKDLIEELPENAFLIVTIGLPTDQNYCYIYSRYKKHFVKASSIIETIENNIWKKNST